MVDYGEDASRDGSKKPRADKKAMSRAEKSKSCALTGIGEKSTLVTAVFRGGSGAESEQQNRGRH